MTEFCKVNTRLHVDEILQEPLPERFKLVQSRFMVNAVENYEPEFTYHWKLYKSKFRKRYIKVKRRNPKHFGIVRRNLTLELSQSIANQIDRLVRGGAKAEDLFTGDPVDPKSLVMSNPVSWTRASTVQAEGRRCRDPLPAFEKLRRNPDPEAYQSAWTTNKI